MKLLVTGGAGYIGSHVVRQLGEAALRPDRSEDCSALEAVGFKGEAGHDVTVYDNLSTGHKQAVLCGKLVVGELSDRNKLEAVFSEGRFEAVLHFAARIIVPESMEFPLQYYSNNTGNTLGLLEICNKYKIQQFIFSSTAAVYGMPKEGTVNEESPLAPISPYGASKMMSERIIIDLARVSPLRYVILRYFNVAGADPKGRIGQATPNATHLIKVAVEAVVGKRKNVTIFGTDYSTKDGTCIRDYIHVEDLASAHVAALDYLSKGGKSAILNCGYGHGYSVREVIETVQRVSKSKILVQEGPRRAGDPAMIVADNKKIQKVLGWKPRHDNLDFIVKTALDWEKKLLEKSVLR